MILHAKKYKWKKIREALAADCIGQEGNIRIVGCNKSPRTTVYGKVAHGIRKSPDVITLERDGRYDETTLEAIHQGWGIVKRKIEPDTILEFPPILEFRELEEIPEVLIPEDVMREQARMASTEELRKVANGHPFIYSVEGELSI